MSYAITIKGDILVVCQTRFYDYVPPCALVLSKFYSSVSVEAAGSSFFIPTYPNYYNGLALDMKMQ